MAGQMICAAVSLCQTLLQQQMLVTMLLQQYTIRSVRLQAFAAQHIICRYLFTTSERG